MSRTVNLCQELSTHVKICQLMPRTVNSCQDHVNN